jgi:hypothetical protein
MSSVERVRVVEGDVCTAGGLLGPLWEVFLCIHSYVCGGAGSTSRVGAALLRFFDGIYLCLSMYSAPTPKPSLRCGAVRAELCRDAVGTMRVSECVLDVSFSAVPKMAPLSALLLTLNW